MRGSDALLTSVGPGRARLTPSRIRDRPFSVDEGTPVVQTTSEIPESLPGVAIIAAATRTSDFGRRPKNVLAHSLQSVIRFRLPTLRIKS